MRALPALLLLLPLAASPAFGQDTPVVMRLQYSAPSAEACPDEQLFRDMMGAHVRRSAPFAPDAPRLLRVILSHRGKGYESFAELRDDATGAVLFTKTYPPTPRCFDAAEDLARGIAIEIERPAVRTPPLTCHSAPLSSSSTPLPSPPPCAESRHAVWPEKLSMSTKAEPPPPPERWPLAIRVGLAAWPEVVASGWGSLGLSLDGGVRYRGFSFSVEGHGDPPLGSLTRPAVGTVTFTRLSGLALLCGHVGWFVGCGVADLGRIWFPHHVATLPASFLYGGAGVRVGLDFPVAPPRLFLRSAVHLLAPIQARSFTTPRGSLFDVAGLSAGLGLGLVLELPP
jgi:hypothetical protein